MKKSAAHTWTFTVMDEHQTKFFTDHETGLAIDAHNSTDTESEVDSLENYASEGVRDMETDGEDLNMYK